MMDSDKFDLSPLDPMRDPSRWQSVVGATLTRVDAAMQRRAQRSDDAFGLIASWRRPLLVAAAALLAILIPAEISLENRETLAEAAHRLASVSVSWAFNNETPSGAEILRAIAEESTP